LKKAFARLEMKSLFHGVVQLLQTRVQEFAWFLRYRFVIRSEGRSGSLYFALVIQLVGFNSIVAVPCCAKSLLPAFIEKWKDSEYSVSNLWKGAGIKSIEIAPWDAASFDRNLDQKLVSGFATPLPYGKSYANKSGDESTKNGRNDDLKHVIKYVAQVVLLMVCFALGICLAFTEPVVKFIEKIFDLIGIIRLRAKASPRAASVGLSPGTLRGSACKRKPFYAARRAKLGSALI